MPELVPPVVVRAHLASQDQPELVSDDLVLRKWLEQDVPALVEAYADPLIQQWHGRSMTPVEALEWVAGRTQRWQAGSGADWAVTRDGAVVGRVSFKGYDVDSGEAEIGYWTLPAARGGEIAARAGRVSSTWMFETGGFHRLVLRHSTLNDASCRIAAKAGFALEGTARGQALHRDGWHDMHVHARLKSD